MNTSNEIKRFGSWESWEYSPELKAIVHWRDDQPIAMRECELTDDERLMLAPAIEARRDNLRRLGEMMEAAKKPLEGRWIVSSAAPEDSLGRGLLQC